MRVSINRISQIFIMLIEQTLRVKTSTGVVKVHMTEFIESSKFFFSEFIEKAITGEFIFFHEERFRLVGKRMSPANQNSEMSKGFLLPFQVVLGNIKKRC